MIFLPKKGDQREKDEIMYRDYSLRKRLETSIKAPETRMADQISKLKNKDDKKSKKEKNVEQKLQCLEVDITNPLSETEWTCFAEVISEVKGLGWFQILPVGQKSSQPYQFNMLHVLPASKFPVEKLPIDQFISNQ